jgi:hypothetical protein
VSSNELAELTKTDLDVVGFKVGYSTNGSNFFASASYSHPLMPIRRRAAIVRGGRPRSALAMCPPMSCDSAGNAMFETTGGNSGSRCG